MPGLSSRARVEKMKLVKENVLLCNQVKKLVFTHKRANTAHSCPHAVVVELTIWLQKVICDKSLVVLFHYDIAVLHLKQMKIGQKFVRH